MIGYWNIGIGKGLLEDVFRRRKRNNEMYVHEGIIY